MNQKPSDDKVDALATDLDDLKLTVEELQEEMPAPADAASLATIRTALERAGEASGDLAERKDDLWSRWASDDPETAALITQARSQFGPDRVNEAAMEALDEATGAQDGEVVSAGAVFKGLLQYLLVDVDGNR